MRTNGKGVKGNPKAWLGKEIYQARSNAMLRFSALPDEVLEQLADCQEENIKDEFGVLLGDPYVSEAIRIASPELHSRLMSWSAGDTRLAHSSKALLRYILRMAYRATPFGLFAAAAVVNTRAHETKLEIPDKSSWRRSVRLDSSAVLKLTDKLVNDVEFASRLRYFPNGTLQRFNDTAHYIVARTAKSGRRAYRLAEVEYSEHVGAALDICKGGATREELTLSLIQKFPDELPIDIDDFVKDIIEQQVLCADQLLKVTSGNLLRSLILEADGSKSRIVPRLKAIDGAIVSLESAPFTGPFEMYDAIRSELLEVGIQQPSKAIVQVDLYADCPEDVGLNIAMTKNVEMAATLLMKLGKNVPNRLGEFAEQFTTRYGDASVPLLEVLDETAGIGFKTPRGQRPLLAACIPNPNKQAGVDPKAGRARELASWMDQRSISAKASHYLNVSDDMAKCMSQASNVTKYPQDVTAWCALWKAEGSEDLALEVRKLSPQKPGRLFGRFAAELPRIRDEITSDADDDKSTVDAEVVHLPPERIGNVVCRPQLSEWEIEIRSGVAAGAKRLLLSDLTVSISNGEVLLYSQSLRCRVRPRMSNAHHFSSAESLQLYYFLNEVAEQENCTIPLSLRGERGGNRFAPGAIYNNVIIARPYWSLFPEDISRLNDANGEEKIKIVSAWREEFGLPAWIALVERDSILPFNLDSSWMAKEFVHALSRMNSAELTDVYPLGLKPAAKGKAGRHHSEILIPLKYPRSEVQRSLEPGHLRTKTSRMPIWSEWLSLNIYCHSDVQNDVLMCLSKKASSLIKSASITSFFFIRYRDTTGSHLRFRVRAVENKMGSSLLANFAEEFDWLSSNGLIANVTHVPYIREVTRYGGDIACSHCEEVFFHDSLLCLNLLGVWDQTKPSAWHVPVAAMDSMLRAMGLQLLSERLQFAERASTNFSKEFAFNSEDRKRIGVVFRDEKILAENGVVLSGNPQVDGILIASDQKISAIWKKVAEEIHVSTEKNYLLRWSVVHMRLNRLFHRDSRLQEAVAWDLLRRTYAFTMATQERASAQAEADCRVNLQQTEIVV